MQAFLLVLHLVSVEVDVFVHAQHLKPVQPFWLALSAAL